MYSPPDQRPTLLLAFLAVLLLGSPADPALAQARTQSPESCSCRLGGHRFILGGRTQNPFVGTQVHTSTGGGMAFGFEDLVEIPVPDSSLIKALTGDLAFVALGFDYQQRLWQRFAVGLGITASARLGIDAQSILSQGVTSVFASHFWFKGQIIRADRHLLSASFDFRPNSAVALDPVGWAKRIIEDGGISDDNELVQSVDAASASVGLQYAWALRPWLGLLASTDLGFGDPLDDQQDRELRWRADGNASIDLNEIWGVPLGFLVGGRYSDFSDAASDIVEKSWLTNLGLFYTGRESFSIGGELTRSSSDLKTSDATLTSTVASFEIRYFF